jgi:hypothetical protein
MRRVHRFFKKFPSPLPLIFIVVGTLAVIFYGRGYRPDFKENQLKPTGLLSATSDPVGSQVYIDGTLKTATNNTLNIEPGWYTVQIAKEGYLPWQKKLRVQGEVVTATDAFMFPSNPSLSPLTTVGIQQPVLSPDGTKIAYIIPVPAQQNGITPKKAGLWVYELVDRSLGFNRDQRQVGITDTNFTFTDSTISWSPDSTQILVQAAKATRLYQINRTDDFQDVTLSVSSLQNDWADERTARQRQRLAAFKQGIVDIATSSAQIIAFSPDETKILYEATAAATLPQVITPPLIGTNSTPEQRTIVPGKIYVYDTKEDKNYFLLDRSEVPISSPIPSPKLLKTTKIANDITGQTTNPNIQANLHWFPTSRHIVLTIPGKIDIMEYDRTNWVTVYSGPFIDGFIAPWPNGSRIIVMTNFNPGGSQLPNLYTVNLR